MRSSRPGCHAFLITLTHISELAERQQEEAGGTGLTLTAASHVIHFDRWWNPAVEDQATDRAFRIGQTKNVLVHKFVCEGTLEERMDELIRDKKALANDILVGDGAAKVLTEMSDADLINFASLDLKAAE